MKQVRYFGGIEIYNLCVFAIITVSESESRKSTRSSESPDTSSPSPRSKHRASSEPSPRVVNAEHSMRTIQERRESIQSSESSRYKDSPTPDRESLHIDEETQSCTAAGNSSQTGQNITQFFYTKLNDYFPLSSFRNRLRAYPLYSGFYHLIFHFLSSCT